MSKSKLYQPPPGYYDLPYSWIYNLGPQPADGQDLLNQFVYILGGYGEFVLRRIVGQCRALKPYLGVPGGQFGRYQFYDRIHAPLEASPVFAWGIPAGAPGLPVEQDIGIAPELKYPETGRIGLDLYTLRRPPLAPNSAQIAFQGVRRIKGTRKRQPDYRAKPKSFTYKMSVTINDKFPAGPITRRIRIDDYDFELYNLIIQQRTCDSPPAFGGPEQVAPVATVATGSFNWQRPNVFLNGNERWEFTTDTAGANWQLRAYLRTNPTGGLNNGTWAEQAITLGPLVSKGTLPALEDPFGCPTFLQDPLDPTKIICCYPRAADSTIAIVAFDMVSKTWGVPITGGPVVHGVDLVFSGSVSSDDTGAKTCIAYRASDNKFVIAYQGPPETVGALNCLRPYYVTFDRTALVWSVPVPIAVAGEAQPYEAHGIVVNPVTNDTYATIIRPPNGTAFPSVGFATYQLWFVQINPDDTQNAKSLMTDTILQTEEPQVSYPVLRAGSGTYELMCAYVNGTLATQLCATVVRGRVGMAPVWTNTNVSKPGDLFTAPGDGSAFATIAIGIGPDGNPYVFWFNDHEAVDFFYRLWYARGGDVGDPWSPPIELFKSVADDSTDFLDNGAVVSPLPGIGFGIIAQAAFLTAAPDGFGAVNGVAYFEFDPCSMSAPLRDTVAALWIYDQNHVPISSAPMLDIYCDGAPGGIYKNGAIVTPLYYIKDSQLQIDFYSQIEAQANVPTILDVYLVGKQYMPC